MIVSQPLSLCQAQTVSKVSTGIYYSQPDRLYVGANQLLDCLRRFLDLEVCSFDMMVAEGNVAIVANQTSVVASRKGVVHLVDTLLAKEVNVTKIFCPEHGFRGTAAAGAHVDNSTDPKTGLPIISLYGKNKKPTPEQMKGVDVVILTYRMWAVVSTHTFRRCIM